MARVEHRKIANIDRGLFLVRYAAAEDEIRPPKVTVAVDPKWKMVVHEGIVCGPAPESRERSAIAAWIGPRREGDEPRLAHRRSHAVAAGRVVGRDRQDRTAHAGRGHFDAETSD